MRVRAVLSVVVLTTGLAGPALAGPAIPGAPADPSSPAGPASPDTQLPGVLAARDGGQRPQHSSDGVRGPIAPEISTLGRHRVRRSTPVTWQVAPGVKVTEWSQTDARGPITAQLLSVRWDQPGVRVNYLNPGRVARTATVGQMVHATRAIAGVNGDFFDIGDTGAPLGVGKRAGGRTLHAPRQGWNSSFFVLPGGQPRIAPLPMQAEIAERPQWAITNVNSPSVSRHGIGVYTSAWGPTSGYRITDGQRRGVRMVVVRRARVVANTPRLSSGVRIRPTDTVLVGRGAGARHLVRLKKGHPARVIWRLRPAPRLAISGNVILVRDGEVKAINDREMHPRTAIGISRDTREILMLVVDGRSSASRGATMVELAELMVRLGAEDALNLDGGGSSTLIARRPGARQPVPINTPSDGQQRAVANGLAVFRAS